MRNPTSEPARTVAVSVVAAESKAFRPQVRLVPWIVGSAYCGKFLDVRTPSGLPRSGAPGAVSLLQSYMLVSCRRSSTCGQGQPIKPVPEQFPLIAILT